MFLFLIFPLPIYPWTLPMHKIIISDTSCFIVLSNIGELDILRKVYSKIITTFEIVSEYGEELPDWVEI
jgi:predicted nucleic acid-binding protein